MDTRLVVVPVVTGLFVLLPLWFAWLSLDGRRWRRVERALGREPPDKEPPRLLWWVWIGLCAVYVVIGVLLIAHVDDADPAASGRPSMGRTRRLRPQA